MGNTVWHTRQKWVRPANIQVETQNTKEVHGCCEPRNEFCRVFQGLLGVLRLQGSDCHDLETDIHVGNDWDRDSA